MSLGTLPLNTVGALTAPAAVNLSFGSEIGSTLKDYGLYDAIPLPTLRSVWISHGQEAMRHVLAGASYRIGILAPQAGQTVAPTGAVRATATLITGNGATTDLANFDAVTFRHSDGSVTTVYAVQFVTTIGAADPTTSYVKRGVSLADTLSNLTKLIMGTGTNGVEYLIGFSYPNGYFYDTLRIEVVGTTGTTTKTTTFRIREYGTDGNDPLFRLSEVIDLGGTWSVTTFAGGTVGTGTNPQAGEFEFAYQHLRTGDGAASGASARTSMTLTSNSSVDQTLFVDASTRFAATHFRQLRTTSGAHDLLRIQDTTIATAEPYVDSVSDVTLAEGANTLPYEEATHRSYAAGCPTIGRYSAIFKGMVWYGGALLAADYTVGTVAVTNGSYSITFSATSKPKEAWIGRTVQITGDTDSYVIVDVDESTKVCAINLPYAGTNAGTATYAVSDKRNPFTLYYSAAQLPNNHPARNNREGITSDDPAGITGIKAAWGQLVIWTKTGVWRVYGDVDSFRLEHVGEGMGCFGGHAIVDVGGVLMWIGRDGIWKWNGAGDPVCVSEPQSPLGSFARGITGTLDEINLDEAEMIVADYNTSERIAMWCVPLGTDTRNNHAIVYDVQGEAFTVWRVPAVSAIASVPGGDSGEVTLAGTAFGGVFQMNLGNCDGVFGVEPVQAFSAYTAGTKTLSGLSGMPTGTSTSLAGCPLIHVSNAGAIQIALIATNTATACVLVSPFTTTPTDGWIVLGGIAFDVMTARYDFDAPDTLKWIVETIVSYDPQASGQLFCAHGIDDSDPALFLNRTLAENDWADLTDLDGEKRFPGQTGRGKRLVQRFLDVTPGHDLTLYSFTTRIGANKALVQAGAP